VTVSEDEFLRAGGQTHPFPGVKDSTEAADLLRLRRLNDAHVEELVRNGRRLSGTGFLPALGTNILNFYWDDRWFTCGDQAVALLSKLIDGGARMDATTNTVRPGDGWAYEIGTTWPNHAFVVATSPTGMRYRVDPWYGYVEKMPR
jgi:hypothetical protein